MRLADTKVCEFVIRELRMCITSSFSVHATKILGSSCCSLCKNRGPTPDVKDRHTGLLLFFILLLVPSYLGVFSPEQSHDILFATFDYIRQTRRRL